MTNPPRSGESPGSFTSFPAEPPAAVVPGEPETVARRLGIERRGGAGKEAVGVRALESREESITLGHSVDARLPKHRFGSA